MMVLTSNGRRIHAPRIGLDDLDLAHLGGRAEVSGLTLELTGIDGFDHGQHFRLVYRLTGSLTGKPTLEIIPTLYCDPNHTLNLLKVAIARMVIQRGGRIEKPVDRRERRFAPTGMHHPIDG